MEDSIWRKAKKNIDSHTLASTEKAEAEVLHPSMSQSFLK